MIGTALADLAAPLSDEQNALLNVMANAFFADNQWPVWDYVQRMLYLEGLDADTVLKSLPVVGATGSLGPSYGLVTFDRVHLATDSRPALTVASGLHIGRFATSVSNPFLLVLQTMVKLEQDAPISTSSVVEVRLTPQLLRRARPSISDIFMGWLPDLLANEPSTWGGGSSFAPDTGDWSRGIRREIMAYEGVRDLSAYVARVSDWATANAPVLPAPNYAALPQQTVGANSASALESEPALASGRQYVSEELIEELGGKGDSTSWSLGKLVGLLRELNSNFADEHPYACHALIRAVLDHVPPILNAEGKARVTFEYVVSTYRWKQTDKKYVTWLMQFKAQGDDVMHRQIRKSADLIDMEDLPPRTWLNALLREVIDAL